VSNEVADAVSELLRDNERLSLEFRAVLDEMERLQTSRDAVSKELRRTKRELEFVSYREKLMEERMQSSKMKGIDARADALAAAEESLDCKAASSSLEEYFKESLQLCDNKSKYRA
jgi:seryl-tRNA synthetase